MRAVCRVLLAVALWAGLAGPVLAQSDPAADAARLAAAHELVEAAGASTIVTNVLTAMRGQMIAAIEQGTSKPTGEVAAIVDELLLPEMKARVGELTESLAMIYAGLFTIDEMQQLAAFYRTPLGAKLIASAPQMAVQSMAVGQAWGRQVAMDALRKNSEELRKRGVKL